MQLPADQSPRRRQAMTFLLGRIDYERALTVAYVERHYKLDRMRSLLARLGNPEARLKIVHVTGTKGKGSTSAMIASVLSAAGYRTGLYSSPHLERLEERLAVDGQPCTADELADLVDLVRPAAAALDAQSALADPPELGPTYFELTTAMALLHFVRREVDLAVLEVGMGGRLDSTNVCLPLVSVITSISLDHTKQLGDTLARIAAEKAGIIKPGVPLVSGVAEDEPRSVIRRTAAQCASRLVELGRDFHFTYRPPLELDQVAHLGQIDFELQTADQRLALGEVNVGLAGRHQAANAAVALATLRQLVAQGWKISDDALRRGLAAVRVPARIEVVHRRPTVVIDSAHNTASVDALLSTLDESFTARRRLLIFATTRDKDARAMLARLLPRFDWVVLTRYQKNPRGVPPEELADLAAELGAAHTQACPDPAAAADQVRALAASDDLVCVTGSFYLAGEMRPLVDRMIPSPAAAAPLG